MNAKHYCQTLQKATHQEVGWDSVVSIATRYGLTGWGSNPSGGKMFCTHPDPPWGPTTLLFNGYLVFPVSKAAGA